MNNKTLLNKLPYIFTGVLLLSWLLVIAIDMVNILNLGDTLVETSPSNISFFHVLFLDRHPVEWIQWTCLIISCVMASQISLLESFRENFDQSAFAFYMSVLFFVLLMEDAGNVRWIITSYTTPEAGFPQPFPRFYQFIVYTLYASIPIYAIARYGSSVLRLNNMTLLFWGGFSLYGIVAAMSASAGIGQWYASVGESLNLVLFDGRVVYGNLEFPGYLIMDALIEETIELVAAILLLTYFTRRRESLNLKSFYIRDQYSKGSESKHP